MCIQGIGIEPDIKVELDEEYKYTAIEDIPRNEDTQLQKAIEELAKK